MRTLLYKFPQNFFKSFSGRNIFFHLLAIVLTYFLVVSGFDWYYFRATRAIWMYFSTAMVLGGILPIIVPLAVLAFGAWRKNRQLTNTAWAMGQAALLGLLISDLYKAFTGRLQPDMNSSQVLIDISHSFNFGFLRHGVFWGWPSSHTTVAFAMSMALFMMYPKKRIIRILSICYALYIGFGVSMSIHWFSDFIAGAIIGTVIGVVVAKSFLISYSS